MIKNIIFDMGEVLLRYTPQRYIDRLDLEKESDKSCLKREVFDSVEWAMLDRGTISEDDAMDAMRNRLPENLRFAVEEIVKRWHCPIEPVEGIAELIKKLKQNGYGIYLLSNAPKNQIEYWKDIPGSEYFDGRIVSADIRIVKPQPEIYKYLLDKFNLQGNESVFIDDNPQNAEASTICGIHPIVFHGDVNELKEKLKQLGVRTE